MIVSAMIIGALVVPQIYSAEGWMELAELAEYFCLTTIKSTCEVQLCSRVTGDNLLILQKFAEQMSMNNLSMHCANHWLRQPTKEDDGGEWVGKLKDLLRLDLAHSSWESPKCIPTIKKGWI